MKSINPFKSVIQTKFDIVKAHGGEIKVRSLSAEASAKAGNDGLGTEFIISLPLNRS